MWFALFLGLSWILALLAVTLTTANPVTFNRQQLVRADFIVVGRWDEKTPGILHKSDPDWWPFSNDTVTVVNATQARAKPGTTMIVPLTLPPGASGASQRLAVTPSPLPNGQPLVYPANASTLPALKTLLRELNIEAGSQSVPTN